MVTTTDINEYRLQMAKIFSAAVALNVALFNNQQDLVKEMRRVMSDIGMIEGFDVGLEMSGNNSAISMMLDIYKSW